MKQRYAISTVGALGLGLLLASGNAFGAATIKNPAGTVALGVNDAGHLNTSTGSVANNAGGFTGLAYNFGVDDFRDATAPGCLCEGWGVSINGTTSGHANADDGVVNLTVGSFASTATTATSVVTLTSTPGLSVTHAYSPADNAPDVFFKSVVTIANNTAAAVTDVKYVRVMDWDIPPTLFNEFVTIKGTASTTLLEKSHLNGFDTADPLNSFCDGDGCGYGSVDVDVTDAGPSDHGAYFRFALGALGVGESYTFTILYGAAADETAALAAIGAEGIELYSLGQSNSLGAADNDAPTFIFGFKGVGGEPVEPDPTAAPEPTSLALFGLGLAGFGAVRRRRRNKA